VKKTIGILGGMGPEVTSHFFYLIIKNTQATSEKIDGSYFWKKGN
jgi:aspartate/glutamate racemase